MAKMRARSMDRLSMLRPKISFFIVAGNHINGIGNRIVFPFRRISRAPLSPRELNAEMMLLIMWFSMVRRWLNWFSARVFCTSQNEKLATKIAQTMTAQNVAKMR